MAKKLLKIGIIGCGAIGGSLARAIKRKLRRKAVLSGVHDLDIKKAEKLSKAVCGRSILYVGSLSRLIDKSDLIVEAASARVSFDIAKSVLGRGRDIMIMSVGGIASGFTKLSSLAEKNNCHIYIPSGAIAGIDALKAAKAGGIKKVMLTTRKNPASFRGVEFIRKQKIDLDKIRKDKILFSGPAYEAVKLFPQNINVAGILSLAGIGADRTFIRIIASPLVSRNVHEIEIESEAGRIFTRTENVLHPSNPKTSYLAVLSAEAALAQILESSRIGT